MIRARKQLAPIVAATLLATAVLASTASPAWASDASEHPKAGEACWVNGDTGVGQCFDSDEEMAAAVYRETGGVLVEENAFARPTAKAQYIVARFYDGASYTGSSTTVTASTSTICATGSVLGPSMLSGWNDRVSSFHSYFGCGTRIYADAGYNGATTVAPDLATLGALDNATSSYRVS